MMSSPGPWGVARVSPSLGYGQSSVRMERHCGMEEGDQALHPEAFFFF